MILAGLSSLLALRHFSARGKPKDEVPRGQERSMMSSVWDEYVGGGWEQGKYEKNYKTNQNEKMEFPEWEISSSQLPNRMSR